jgi:hypothetical protein
MGGLPRGARSPIINCSKSDHPERAGWSILPILPSGPASTKRKNRRYHALAERGRIRLALDRVGRPEGISAIDEAPAGKVPAAFRL